MMGTNNFSYDFKRDAVAQITERGYPVSEVSKRLGVSTHSHYAWKKKFSKPTDPGGGDQAAEIRRLKQELIFPSKSTLRTRVSAIRLLAITSYE